MLRVAKYVWYTQNSYMHELRWLQTTGQLGICNTYPYLQELVRAPARAVGGLQGVQSWRVACGRRRWKIYGEMDWGGKRCVKCTSGIGNHFMSLCFEKDEHLVEIHYGLIQCSTLWRRPLTSSMWLTSDSIDRYHTAVLSSSGLGLWGVWRQFLVSWHGTMSG